MLPSCSIIGRIGVKAKRPIPMATDSAIMPAIATRQAEARASRAAGKGDDDGSACCMAGMDWNESNRHFMLGAPVHPEK